MKRRKSCLLLLLAMLCMQTGCKKQSEPVSAANDGRQETDDYERRRQELTKNKDSSQKLSEKELKAEEKLTSCKQELIDSYGGYTFFPYDMPTLNDTRLTGSSLYALCEKMPKGADLRSQDCTGLSMERLLMLISDRTDFHVCLDDGFCYGYMYDADIGPFPENSIMLKEGMENGRLSDARLMDMWTLRTLTEFPDPGTKLEKVRVQTDCINLDEKLVKSIYKETFLNYINENVSLVEIRLSYTADDEKNRRITKLVRDAYYEAKKKSPDFTVRIIAVSDKDIELDKDEVKGALESAMKLREDIKDESDKSAAKHFIIGFDIAGTEDGNRPLADFVKMLSDDKIKDSGLKLFLSAGESLAAENTNLADAYLLGAARVGHGLNLSRFPEMIDKYKQDGVCLEICPISNCRQGYTSDLRLHPAVQYIRNGNPVVLCSDKARYTEYNALADDYFAAVMCWDLGLADLKQLAKNSIKYSGLPDEERKALEEKWENDWDSFIDDMQ
ncbi:MAG: hypothetical protein IKS17_00170 [Firmicutes bacterium]|nr:hypothetical protein [Bacillota bacterium]